MTNTPEEPFAGQTPMEEDSDESMWERDEPMERPDVDMLEREQEPAESPIDVDFDLEDCETFDQLDDEMFPRKTFEMDAASDASEESFASVRAEEGADSDIELFEEPPPGAQFRY